MNDKYRRAGIPQILEKDRIIRTPLGKLSWNNFAKFYQKYACIGEYIRKDSENER